jgi:DNA polymerase-3 subunit beta
MVGTDGHRLAVIRRDLGDALKGEKLSYLIPKKALAELMKLIEDEEATFSFSAKNNHMAFMQGDQVIVSRKIDGKFPNYVQVIPKNNQKKLEIDLKLFLDSVDRVASVSLDKKDGVKFNLSKDTLNLSVNNANCGDGKESLNVKFDHDLEISFNSRYLIDVASQLDGDKIEIFFNDTGSPALIKDPSDFDSIYVVMPMKG